MVLRAERWGGVLESLPQTSALGASTMPVDLGGFTPNNTPVLTSSARARADSPPDLADG
jgi:hypothetical protein